MRFEIREIWIVCELSKLIEFFNNIYLKYSINYIIILARD
jgi:hypothetical protein